MTYRITSTALDEPWEGTLDELHEQNPELPDFVVRRLEHLPVGQSVRPPVGEDTFEITRVA